MASNGTRAPQRARIALQGARHRAICRPWAAGRATGLPTVPTTIASSTLAAATVTASTRTSTLTAGSVTTTAVAAGTLNTASKPTTDGAASVAAAIATTAFIRLVMVALHLVLPPAWYPAPVRLRQDWGYPVLPPSKEGGRRRQRGRDGLCQRRGSQSRSGTYQAPQKLASLTATTDEVQPEPPGPVIDQPVAINPGRATSYLDLDTNRRVLETSECRPSRRTSDLSEIDDEDEPIQE